MSKVQSRERMNEISKRAVLQTDELIVPDG